MSHERLYRRLLPAAALALTLGVATLRPPAAQAEYTTPPATDTSSASSGDPKAQEPTTITAEEYLKNPNKYLGTRVSVTGYYYPLSRTIFTTKRQEIVGVGEVVVASNVKKRHCLLPSMNFKPLAPSVFPPGCVLLDDRRVDYRIVFDPKGDPFNDKENRNRPIVATGIAGSSGLQPVPKEGTPRHSILVEEQTFTD